MCHWLFKTIKLVVGEVVNNVLSVYAPQSWLTIADKKSFYDSLQNLVITIDDSEMLLIYDGCNGDVGQASLDY